MNLNRILFRVALCFFLVVLLLGAIIFWAADPLNFRAPKDKKLLRIFHDHLEAFEKIEQMAIEDSGRGRYFTESGVEQSKFRGGNVDESRLHEYGSLLSQIQPGLDWGIDGHDDVVRFIFAGGGLLAIGPGWLKGIEYVLENIGWQGTILKNLDSAGELSPGIYLREIESNWFIVYHRTDD